MNTNVLLHLFSTEIRKADRASELLENESILSVQVLSELTAVARRKRKVDWRKFDDIVTMVLDVCRVEALTLDTCRDARRSADRDGMSWHKAMIAASALRAGCTRLYSEDVQHGELIDRRLELVNPFV